MVLHFFTYPTYCPQNRWKRHYGLILYPIFVCNLAIKVGINGFKVLRRYEKSFFSEFAKLLVIVRKLRRYVKIFFFRIRKITWCRTHTTSVCFFSNARLFSDIRTLRRYVKINFLFLYQF